MNISGIRPISKSEIYNSISKSKSEGTDLSVTKEKQITGDIRKDADDSVMRKQQMFDAVDYAKQYDPGVSFNMKGIDSDLMKLDVEKAISDMQKDQVLVQYQFFVGENMEQGRVIPATPKKVSFREDENFDI